MPQPNSLSFRGDQEGATAKQPIFAVIKEGVTAKLPIFSEIKEGATAKQPIFSGRS